MENSRTCFSNPKARDMKIHVGYSAFRLIFGLVTRSISDLNWGGAPKLYWNSYIERGRLSQQKKKKWAASGYFQQRRVNCAEILYGKGAAPTEPVSVVVACARKKGGGQVGKQRP